MVNNHIIEDININADNRDSFNFREIIPDNVKPNQEKMELVTILWYSRSRAEAYGMITEERIEDPMAPEDITLCRSTLM